MNRCLQGLHLIGARMPDDVTSTAATAVQKPQQGDSWGTLFWVGGLCGFIGFFLGVAVCTRSQI